MKNIYPKLAAPLLFAFASCASNQTEKPTIPQAVTVVETADTVKNATDTDNNKLAIVNTKTEDGAKAQPEQGVALAQKASVAKTPLTDLPAPPHFENEEVNRGVHEFDAMIRENMMAEQNHDTAKMKALKTQMNSLPTNIAIWIFNMSADERKAFKAYLENIEKIAKTNTANR